MSDVGALIVQNLITGNKAPIGGGISTGQTESVIVNNTIADNDSFMVGSFREVSGISIRVPQGLQLINNIIVAKPGQVGLRCDTIGVLNARFNNIFSAGGQAYAGACPDMTGTNRNISADPLFANPTQGDYHLQQWSPSIDAGDNQAPNLPDKDLLDEDPRILDGDCDAPLLVDAFGLGVKRNDARESQVDIRII